MARSPVFSKFLPPPTGGIDLTKVYVSGTPETALELSGFICRPEGLVAPQGPLAPNVAVSSTAGMTIIPALTQYFLATNTGIFSSAGVNQGVTWTASPARSNYVTFKTGASSFIFACNSSNIPVVYNGTTWSAITFSGPSSLANLKYVWSHRHRLYFAEGSKLSLWYGNPDAVTGTLTEYNMGSLFRKSGDIASIKSLTMDGGYGPDDILAVLSTGGEIALFSGSDPSAVDWQVLGVFEVGIPIVSSTSVNSGIMTPLGGDLLVLTYNGIVSVSAVIRGKSAGLTTSISTAINPLLRHLQASSYFATSKTGCGLTVLPTQNILILELSSDYAVPYNSMGSYVMDLTTGGWSRFEGQPVINTSFTGYSAFNSFTEFSLNGTVVVYGVLVSSTTGIANATRCFTVFGGTTYHVGLGDWRIRYPYMRLGLVDPFRITTVRPQLLLGDVLPTTFSYTQSLAYNMSGSYQGNVSNQYGDLINEFAAADNLFQAFVPSVAARITRAWKTFPAHNGHCVSYLINGANTASSPGEMRFLGVDLRVEQIENMTP